MKLIGITGKAGSGKDSVAGFLSDMSRCAQINPFAGTIKAMLEPLLVALGENPNWEDREWKERVIPKLGVSPRRLAQTLGTEWGRNLIHQDIWVLAAEAHILRNHVKGYGFAFPDVRFENEADMIRRNGGVIWHITRPGVAAVEAHSSENGIEFKAGDVLIENTGTLDDLREKVEAALG